MDLGSIWGDADVMLKAQPKRSSAAASGTNNVGVPSRGSEKVRDGEDDIDIDIDNELPKLSRSQYLGTYTLGRY